MKLTRSFVVLAFVSGALGLASTASAGELKDLKMGPEQKILGGRLLIRLPKDAQVEEATAQGTFPVLQSRITVRAGGDELYILAQEMLQLAPNNYEETVRKLAGDVEAKIERLETGNENLRVYAVWPEEISAGAEANLLLTLFVAHRDRSVELVTFFINGAAAADAGGSRVLGKRIARSLSAGPRPLKRVEGLTTLRAPGGSSVRLKLPKKSVITRDAVSGSSAQYTIHKMVTLGAPHAGTLSVEIGGGSDYRFKEFTAEPIKRDGKLAGESTEWYAWQVTLPSGALASVLEARAEPRVSDGIVPLHVYVMADDQAELATWQRIASSVEVVR